MNKFKTSAVILAGGSGNRMMSDKTKQFMDILGMTVLERTVLAFEKSSLIDEITVVVREDEKEIAESLLRSDKYLKPLKICVVNLVFIGVIVHKLFPADALYRIFKEK